MKELGMKSRVFIYYLQNTEKGKSTNKFKIDFVNENEKAKYFALATEKLTKRFGHEPKKWMIKSEAEIMLDQEAFEARNWLVENGFLFINDYSKHNGGMTVHYTGVTNKGWEVAPKYLALVK